MWQAICSHSLKGAASPSDQIHVKVYDSERDKIMGILFHLHIIHVPYT